MPSGLTVFVDTQVRLYAVDPRDPAKQSAAQAWLQQCWRRDCGRIGTQAAWALQDRLNCHCWDALMLAAAQAQGCTVMLTEDLQHDQRIDTLRIVNPFLAGPGLLDEPP